MRMKLTPRESQIYKCQLCGGNADFIAIMKVAGNKFLCNRCVK